MAKSNNPLTNGFRGSLNKQMVFRQVAFKTIVSAYPDFSYRKFSKLQLEKQKTMKDANEYAQTVRADKALHDAALVRLNVTKSKLYTELISEYWENIKSNAAVKPV